MIPGYLYQKIKDVFLSSSFFYKFYLSAIKKYKPAKFPDAPWHNAVLKNESEWKNALKSAEALSLPVQFSSPKAWDELAILDCILRNTGKDSVILEAGANLDSPIMDSLFLFGYKNLTGINLKFKNKIRRGRILYEPGDIINTHFPNEMFDAIACQSVIEHAVDLEKFFKESSRILKHSGLLIVSCDYWKDPVQAQGKFVYGAAVKIFTRKEVEDMFITAGCCGLELISPIDLSCNERPVKWLDLEYTFLVFTMRKKAAPAETA